MNWERTKLQQEKQICPTAVSAQVRPRAVRDTEAVQPLDGPWLANVAVPRPIAVADTQLRMNTPI
jgi:hypothetical protein